MNPVPPKDLIRSQQSVTYFLQGLSKVPHNFPVTIIKNRGTGFHQPLEIIADSLEGKSSSVATEGGTMNEAEVKQKLDFIFANGDSFQKRVISKCIAVVHYEVGKKNNPKSRQNFEDYRIRIERVFTYGTNEQISGLLGNLLVQEHNVQMNPAHRDEDHPQKIESSGSFGKQLTGY